VTDPGADCATGPAPDAVHEELVKRVDLPSWAAPVFLGFVIALVPWIIWLALSLPSHHTDRIYDVTWVGFDVGLLVALGMVMLLAMRRSRLVEIAAAVAGTMLVVDAWFDITTSTPGADRWEAIGAAVLIELPIAGLCWWLTRNAEAVRVSRAEYLLRHVTPPSAAAQRSAPPS
jgi:hypothetical protein